MFGRRKVATLVAEFLSTAVLSIAMLSMIGRTTFPFFLAMVGGLTLGGLAYLFGTHANPVITIGLWTMRKVKSSQAVLLIIMQMLGGLAAWQLSEYLLNSPLKNIAGESFDWRILLAEALGAFVLGMGIAVAVTRAYDGARLATVMGLSYTLGILIASLVANGLLNPAVALGVQSWNWAYALGPVLGGVIGMSLYGVLYAQPTAVAVETRSTRPISVKKTVVKKPVVRKRK